MPTFGAEQFTNLAIAITAILFGQSDQDQAQIIISPGSRLVMQGAAGQPNNTAGVSFRRAKLLACVNDSSSEIVTRQALGFKKSILSLRITLSSSR